MNGAFRVWDGSFRPADQLAIRTPSRKTAWKHKYRASSDSRPTWSDVDVRQSASDAEVWNVLPPLVHLMTSAPVP